MYYVLNNGITISKNMLSITLHSLCITGTCTTAHGWINILFNLSC